MAYPPNKEECLKLFEELKTLGTVGDIEFAPRKHELIHDLAEAHFYDAKPYFISGLDSPDPDFRWACISALATHWQENDPRVITKIIWMADRDNDIQVRMIAISSLGNLKVKIAEPLLKKISEERATEKDLVQEAKEALIKLSAS